MKALVYALLTAALVAPLLDAGDARAADLAARVYRERLYSRPVPRVYYQPVRPAAVCRVALLRDGRDAWPTERGRVARCTRFD